MYDISSCINFSSSESYEENAEISIIAKTFTTTLVFILDRFGNLMNDRPVTANSEISPVSPYGKVRIISFYARYHNYV